MCNASFGFTCDFDDFLINHPVLGRADKDNIYFEKPLFESIQVGMKEPQYTTALDWFLKNDQEACRLFIKTLADVANFPDDFKEILPAKDTRIESTSEERGSQNEGKEASKSDKSENNKKKHGSKEIDNLLIWESDGKKYGIVIEIKFRADLHNDLPCYQKIALKKISGKEPVSEKHERGFFCVSSEKLPPDPNERCLGCYRKRSLFCITLSSKVISDEEIQNNGGCPKIWHRVLWRNLMPKLDENMRYSETKNEDYRRFLSSLWRKTLTL